MSWLLLHLDHSLCGLALANLQLWHPDRVLVIEVANIRPRESSYSSIPEKVSVESATRDNTRNLKTDGGPRYKHKPFKLFLQTCIKKCLELHPPWLCTKSCLNYPIIVLHLVLYFLPVHSLPDSPTIDVRYSKWNLCPARWGITIHRRIKKHT